MSDIKAPGPDGFNAAFYKKSWSTVGQEFTKAVQHVLQSGVCPRGINSTFICLIPKVQNPCKPEHFRPIYILII